MRQLGWSYKAEVGDPSQPLLVIAKGVKVTWDPHIDFGEYPEGVEVISDIADDVPFWLPLTKNRLGVPNANSINLRWKKSS